MSFKTVFLGLGLIAALAACNGDDDNETETEEEETSSLQTLGTDFVTALDQDANDDPIAVDRIVLVLTPRIEPFRS